jgi:hypothetical protein
MLWQLNSLLIVRVCALLLMLAPVQYCSLSFFNYDINR